MNRRTSVLAVLRRQRGRLGRLVVACFALASFTITAAPCFAMAAAKVDAGEHAAHSHGQAHHGHAMDHGGTAPAMPNHAPSSSHSFCSAYDEPADQTCFTAPMLTKHALLAPAFETPPPLVFHPPLRSSPHTSAFKHSAVALNLRNCVLLI